MLAIVEDTTELEEGRKEVGLKGGCGQRLETDTKFREVSLVSFDEEATDALMQEGVLSGYIEGRVVEGGDSV